MTLLVTLTVLVVAFLLATKIEDVALKGLVA